MSRPVRIAQVPQGRFGDDAWGEHMPMRRAEASSRFLRYATDVGVLLGYCGFVL